MRSLMTVFALLGALLAGGFLGGCGGGPDIGISGADPVGSMAGIEAACSAKGLSKGTMQARRAKVTFGGWVDPETTPGLTFTTFADSVPGYQHHLVVVSDAGGKVKALAGEFRSGALVFSATAFPGHELKLERGKEDAGGYWYFSRELGMEGWLCPALFKYFDVAPEVFYAQFKERKK